MTVVGIDIGRGAHVAAVCRDGTDQADRGVLRMNSRRAGFDQLDAWLDLQGEVSLVVMESSGHYWMPLASHLRRQGRAVAVVNPLTAKYFAKSRMQRTKSNPADARTLAALGRRPESRSPAQNCVKHRASR